MAHGLGFGIPMAFDEKKPMGVKEPVIFWLYWGGGAVKL